MHVPPDNLSFLKTIDHLFGPQNPSEAGTEILDWMVKEHVNRAITS